MSMYYQLCDENERLRSGIVEQNKVLIARAKENEALRKILKEIVGDYDAAYSVGLISLSMYSIEKAKKLLKELEAK